MRLSTLINFRTVRAGVPAHERRGAQARHLWRCSSGERARTSIKPALLQLLVSMMCSVRKCWSPEDPCPHVDRSSLAGRLSQRQRSPSWQRTSQASLRCSRHMHWLRMQLLAVRCLPARDTLHPACVSFSRSSASRQCFAAIQVWRCTHSTRGIPHCPACRTASGRVCCRPPALAAPLLQALPQLQQMR